VRCYVYQQQQQHIQQRLQVQQHLQLNCAEIFKLIMVFTDWMCKIIQETLVHQKNRKFLKPQIS
jgi:hypothetical protein